MATLPEYMQEMVDTVKADIYTGFETAKAMYRDITGLELPDEQVSSSFRSEYIQVIGYLNRVSDINKTDEHKAKLIAYQRVMNELRLKV